MDQWRKKKIFEWSLYIYIDIIKNDYKTLITKVVIIDPNIKRDPLLFCENSIYISEHIRNIWFSSRTISLWVVMPQWPTCHLSSAHPSRIVAPSEISFFFSCYMHSIRSMLKNVPAMILVSYIFGKSAEKWK